MMIDPLLFAAVAALYHDAMARRPPRLPRDKAELLALALRQQESFRVVLLDDSPAERLQAAAAFQFHILVALCEHQARSRGTGGGMVPEASTTALYSEMIRRLLASNEGKREFGLRSARDYLEPIAVAFRHLTQPLRQELAEGDQLAEIQRRCAEYLNNLAFALYSFQHLPVTSSLPAALS